MTWWTSQSLPHFIWSKSLTSFFFFCLKKWTWGFKVNGASISLQSAAELIRLSLMWAALITSNIKLTSEVTSSVKAAAAPDPYSLCLLFLCCFSAFRAVLLLTVLCFPFSPPLPFPPAFSKTIKVKIIDDEEYEKNKTFYVELGEPRLVENSDTKVQEEGERLSECPPHCRACMFSTKTHRRRRFC